MLVLELLKYVGAGSVDGRSIEVANAIAAAGDREFRWAIDAGLGPLLLDATRSVAGQLPPSRRDILLGAELTAQIISDCRISAAKEIIDACIEIAVPITLLKGISISDELYPASHLRRMTDVDILVPLDSYDAVEASVLRRGFQRGPEEASDDLHHGTPLFDPKRRVWLEIHKTLFPLESGLRSGKAFNSASISAQTVQSTFHGRQVLRLSRELQLAYIASSWMRDLTLFGPHPSIVIALFDATYVMISVERPVSWQSFSELLDNDIARASLLAMLSYLRSRGVAAAPDTPRPVSYRWRFGCLELFAMQRMLDRNLLAGNPWTCRLPPPVPGRYNVLRQIHKRLLGGQDS
jgi:hypothetical protein